MNFKVQTIQVALFIKDLNIAGYDKYALIGDLKEKVGSIFDAEPVVLPLPPNAPSDIPRVILNNKEGSYNCNIALNRVDVFKNKPQSEEDLKVFLDDQKEKTIIVFDFLKEKHVVVNRVGFIVTSLVEIEDKTGPEYLKEAFVASGKLDDPRELRMIYNKRENDFNHLIKMTTKQDNKLLLQIDVNTIPELMAEADFDGEKLESILNYAIEKIIKIQGSFPNFNI